MGDVSPPLQAEGVPRQAQLAMKFRACYVKKVVHDDDVKEHNI